MILLISLMFTFFLLGIHFIFRNKNDDRFFSPLSIGLLFIFITNVPYMISLHFDYNLLHVSVQSRISEFELPMAIFKYTLLLSVGVFFLGLGVNSKKAKKFANKIPILFHEESNNKYKLAAYLSILTGLSAYLVFFNQAGGFLNWIDNLNTRASFTTGNGYLMSLMGLLSIGVYIYIYTFKYKKNFFKYIILFFLFVIVLFMTSSLGGRRSVLLFIIYCLLIWNFGVNKIKNLLLKVGVLVPIILFYILAVPILRTSPEDIEVYMNNPEVLIEEAGDDLNKLTKQLSFVDHQLFIMDYFNVDNIWLGKSYMDLLYAPIPRSIYPEKPPIDDGVYIRTLAAGHDVSPPTSYDKLYPSSWPPETFGAAYMNFSVIGVLIAMYLLGIIYSVSYNYMKKSQFSLISILIYGNIITNFQFSNLKIVQILSEIVVIVILFSLFFDINKDSPRNKKSKINESSP